MVKCMKSSGQVILPIFYHVEPSDARRLKGDFGQAFLHFSEKYERQDVDNWTQALREVADLKGWDSKAANGYEAELVKLVVTRVWSELKNAFQLVVTENLVGIDNPVEEVLSLLDDNSNATKIISIYGIGGIGKTTLAKFIYNKLMDQFKHRSFIANIRESSRCNNILSLQSQLIYDILNIKEQVSNMDEGIQTIESRCSGKKVLLLLDDVDHKDQLKPLVGKHDWFGKGSSIIITTRSKDVLNNDDEVNCEYELKGIDVEQSLTLFSRHAFLENSPPPEFESLSYKIISTTEGLPLALEVIGSSLLGKDLATWQNTFDKLKEVLHAEVREKLMISYDALEFEEQQMFLDIACFFTGTDVRIPSYMWTVCKFYPKVGIEKLRLRSLIKIGDDYELRMHDQLRDLGRRIASEGKPMERRRLWAYDKALEALQEDQVNNRTIEALRLDKDGSRKFMDKEIFKRMPNLQFLHLSEVDFAGDCKKWETCPDSFNPTHVHLKELLIFDLSGGNICKNWGGWSLIKMEKLKVLNLSGCSHLKITPNLSSFENLEMVILEGCEDLEEIGPSIGEVKHLVSLNLRYCGRLKKLPAELGELKELEELLVDETDIQEFPECIKSLKKLKMLSAVGCRLLTQIPSSISNLVKLSTLNLDTCKRLPELPDSVQSLVELERLSLVRCYMLNKIPSMIGELKLLTELDLSSTGVMELPESIEKLQGLEILRVSHSAVEKLPRAVGKLGKLQELDASGCHKLKGEILIDPSRLSSLKILRLGSARISNLPKDIHKLSTLEHLDLLNCNQLQSLPELPPGLTFLQLTCQSRTLPQLCHLSYLKELTLHVCMSLESIPELPSRLLKLRVWKCYKLKTLPDLSNLKSLSKLELLQCYNLTGIEGLKALKSLRTLDVSTGTELSDLHDFEDLESLRYSDLESYDEETKNIELEGLDELECLEVLNISARKSITKLDLSKSERLKRLIARNCESLTEIRGLDKLELLEELDISRCKSIMTLPDFSACKKLRILEVKYCEKLTELQGLKPDLTFDTTGCNSMRTIPGRSVMHTEL